MTQQEIVDHWRNGARDALEMGQLAFQAEKYDHALFNCHLAVEKALKALYMEQHDEDHPHAHDLFYLSGLVQHALSANQIETLKELTGFVVDARYSDPFWMKEEATKENVAKWMAATEKILSLLLHD